MFKLIENLLTSASHALANVLAIPVQAQPVGEPDGIKRVGVWAGRSAMRNPKRSAREMAKIGVSDCYIMINDFSADRGPRYFAASGGVGPLADACNEAGIRVHLTTWIMPHRCFVSSMCASMPGLVKRTNARSVLFDAEEPWTLAKGHMGRAKACALLASLMDADPWGVPIGVTGIGYASTRKLAPLALLCDYFVAQCYSTHTSKLDCRTVAKKFVKVWISKFGQGEHRVGLAAYRQKGVKGSDGTELDAMFKAIQSVPAEVDEIILWWLPTLRWEDAKARAVASAREIHAEGLASQ